MSEKLKRRLSLQVLINLLFSILVLTVGLTIILVGQNQTEKILIKFSEEKTADVVKQVEANLQARLAPLVTTMDLIGNSPLMNEDGEVDDSWVASIGAVMKGMPAVSAIYKGMANGDAAFIRSAKSQQLRKYITRGYDKAVLMGEYNRFGVDNRVKLYDKDFKVLQKEKLRPRKFDPRLRPWYKDADKSGAVSIIGPYLDYTTNRPVITVVKMAPDKKSVLAADTSVEIMSQIIDEHSLISGSILLLLDEEQNILACNVKQQEVEGEFERKGGCVHVDEMDIAAFKSIHDYTDLDNAQWQQKDGRENWRSSLIQIKISDSAHVCLAIAIPESELLKDVVKIRDRLLIIAVIILVLAIPAVTIFSSHLSRPLKLLIGEMESVRQFNFTEEIKTKSVVREVKQLGSAMQLMKDTINNFIALLTKLAGTRDFDELLKTVSLQCGEIGHADGVVMAIIDESDEDFLDVAFVQGIGERLPKSRYHMGTILKDTVVSGKPLSLVTFKEEWLSAINAKCYSAFPINDRDGTAVGVLALCYDRVPDFNQYERYTFIENLLSFSSLTMESRHMITQQKALLDSFIKILAIAVDAKSPYTGGHCQRVPEIAILLTQTLCDQKTGEYADFSLNSEQWEELKIAAWLHDCGKVTTPEYVMDKSTKLETIYDRIHEIRMRFELLKKQAEVDFWHGIASGGDEELLRNSLEEAKQQLDEDYNFVAECNIGGEFMADEKIERLEQIAAKKWQRTLSDRIGISHEEFELKEKNGTEILPVEENLLADRREHLVDWHKNQIIPEDNQWGFKLKMPKFEYNRGEVYNLAVKKGTLTAEERYKINDHIVETIIMLTELPFPKYLKNVPEIAGGHHEKMDGTGYPKKLTGGELSLLARVMVIADIFEALTAADRPYKKAKTLSETLKIMSFMAKDQHIDADLFQLFLDSKVYKKYADRFLKPEQIDEVKEEVLG